MTRADMVAPLTAYRLDIDGLRALAVLLVLVFHFELAPLGKAGFIGVDVFFVISGFLITSILRSQLDAGRFGLRAFYIGRVRRLAPALLATLALTMVAGALLLPQDLTDLSKQALWSQLYAANFYYWRNINYFGLNADAVYLLHMWSLCVEEQFYLLYPLALLCLHRWARRWFWPGIAAGLCLSFTLNLALVAPKPQATFYLLPTRAWELLAGALVCWARLGWRRAAYVDGLLGLGGLAAIAIAVLSYRADIAFPGSFALLPVAGGAALILAGDSASSPASRLLSLRPLVYVGQISYPLYLVHWPINVFAQQWLHDGYGLAWRTAMFGLSLLLAALLYHAIEQPVRLRRVLAVNARLLCAYAAGLAATVVLFAVVQRSGGLPQRFPDRVVELAAYVNDRSPPLTECEFSGDISAGPSALPLCSIGAAGKAPRWLVYGDSHAWAAHAVFDRWLKLRGEAGLFVYRNSCPPLVGMHLFGDGGRCHAFNGAVIEYLRRQAGIDHVVLVSTWLQASEGKLTTATDRLLSREASMALFADRFADTMTVLSAMGKQVYLWEPVPGAKRSVPQALALAALTGRPADIEFSREQYRATFAFFFAALQRNRAMVSGTFSPSDALCASGRCAVSLDGVPLYFDNAHVTRSPADFWVGVLQRAGPPAAAAGPAAGS